jgi:hypothetical protein
MTPIFWELSMGPGTSGGDFKGLLEVLDWLRQGLVSCTKTPPQREYRKRVRESSDVVLLRRTPGHGVHLEGRPAHARPSQGGGCARLPASWSTF